METFPYNVKENAWSRDDIKKAGVILENISRRLHGIPSPLSSSLITGMSCNEKPMTELNFHIDSPYLLPIMSHPCLHSS